VLIAVFVSSAVAQTSWWRTYGGPSDDYGTSAQPTSDGGYVITGFTGSFGPGGPNVWLIKTDASGDTLWTRTYGGTNYDYGNSVQPTSDGGYIVAGYTNTLGPGRVDVYLINTNATGDTLWTRTYGGTNEDEGWSVQQSSDGGYVIAGVTYSFGAGGGDVYLVKTNASGDTLWTRTYGGTHDDCGYSVQQTVDGGYIIAGMTNSSGAGPYDHDVYLIKTNASGDTLWTRSYGDTNYDVGYSVQQTSDGGYIVAGRTTSFGAGYGDVYLIRTNASGDTVWTRTYGGTDDDLGHSVQQTTDGGYIIAGETYSFGAGSRDAYLIKTNASGDTLWTRTDGGTDEDRGSSVEQTTDGGYIIAGFTESFGSGGSDVYLVKTDADGHVAVEEPSGPRLTISRAAFRVQPNPFRSFAVVPGHETDRFILSDISGRKVGICDGDRIGEGLPPGVYFLSPIAEPDVPHARLLRIVKGGWYRGRNRGDSK